MPDAHVRIGPVADWVKQDELADYAAPTQEKTEIGYDYLLIDEQEQVEQQASYSRFAYRITSNAALQNAAQVAVAFDPAYQTVDFHFVRVIRGAQVSDRLAPDKIRTFEQERDLDRHEINGEMTALIVLDDVRVGDVVDFAYTCHGRNPIFGRHFQCHYTVNWYAPVRRERIRVVTGQGHPLAWREHGARVLTANSRVVGSQVEYLWTASSVPAVEVDPQLPVWFFPYAILQISDFPDWGAVVSWAQPLYAAPSPVPEAVRKKTNELIAGLPSEEQQALAILNFVQQDIRYLGIQLGPHSHRPSPPDQVLERRYGDCKDKALLFCTMLGHAGIVATPAFTHDTRRQTMRDWLPSPDVFDHVIAKIKVDGRTYWVDPTLTDQTGALSFRALPDYRLALLLTDGATNLTDVVVPPSASATVRSHEFYLVAAIEQPAIYEIITQYHSAAADRMRADRRQIPAAQLAKYLLNFRARLYPKLTSEQPPVWKDDEYMDTLTCTERYAVPDLWRQGDAKSSWKAEFYPQVLRDYLLAPQSVNRSMPLAIDHPVDITYDAVVSLPVTFPTSPIEQTVHGDAFTGSASIHSSGDKVTILYRYETLADHVPADRVGAHADALKSFRDHVGYTLQYTPPPAQ